MYHDDCNNASDMTCNQCLLATDMQAARRRTGDRWTDDRRAGPGGGKVGWLEMCLPSSRSTARCLPRSPHGSPHDFSCLPSLLFILSILFIHVHDSLLIRNSQQHEPTRRLDHTQPARRYADAERVEPRHSFKQQPASRTSISSLLPLHCYRTPLSSPKPIELTAAHKLPDAARAGPRARARASSRVAQIHPKCALANCVSPFSNTDALLPSSIFCATHPPSAARVRAARYFPAPPPLPLSPLRAPRTLRLPASPRDVPRVLPRGAVPLPSPVLRGASTAQLAAPRWALPPHAVYGRADATTLPAAQADLHSGRGTCATAPATEEDEFQGHSRDLQQADS